MIDSIECKDGSFTAYSAEFEEHYHSVTDGALSESLYKHVIPAMEAVKGRDSVRILDICFGLGFNTLATVYYLQQHSIDMKLEILSVELDHTLVSSLKSFAYPQEFDDLRHIISSIASTGSYSSDQISIEVVFMDAREFVATQIGLFDIIYQDAFSPSSNPTLWTLEYFKELDRLTHNSSIITTYSIALKTRLALYRNNFKVYLNSIKECRDSTLASKSELVGYKKIDMEHKIACNSLVEPLRDRDL